MIKDLINFQFFLEPVHGGAAAYSSAIKPLIQISPPDDYDVHVLISFIVHSCILPPLTDCKCTAASPAIIYKMEHILSACSSAHY